MLFLKNNYKKGIKFKFFQRFSYIVLRNTIVLPIGEPSKFFKLKDQINVLERFL